MECGIACVVFGDKVGGNKTALIKQRPQPLGDFFLRKREPRETVVSSGGGRGELESGDMMDPVVIFKELEMVGNKVAERAAAHRPEGG